MSCLRCATALRAVARRRTCSLIRFHPQFRRSQATDSALARKSPSSTFEPHDADASLPSTSRSGLSSHDELDAIDGRDQGNSDLRGVNVSPSAHEEYRSSSPQKKGQRNAIRVTVERMEQALPNALAVIREFELLFGKVREFKLFPDKDLPTYYRNVIEIDFESDESMKGMQEYGFDYVSVKKPAWNRGLRTGGEPGLQELGELLRPRRTDGDPTSSSSVHDLDPALAQSSDLVAEANEQTDPDTVGDNVDYSTGNVALDRQISGEKDMLCKFEAFSQKEGFRAVRLRSIPPTLSSANTLAGQRFRGAFVNWGGFYGYNLQDAEDRSAPEALNAEEGVEEMPLARKARVVRVATETMRERIDAMRKGSLPNANARIKSDAAQIMDDWHADLSSRS